MNEMDPIDNIVIAATCISASQKIHDDDGQLNSRRDNHPILEVKSRHATRKNLFLILWSDHIVTSGPQLANTFIPRKSILPVAELWLCLLHELPVSQQCNAYAHGRNVT